MRFRLFRRAIHLVAALAVIFTAVGQTAEPSLPTLTRIEQIRKMSNADAARHFPVRFEGVVTYIDPDNPLFYFIVIQNGSDGITVGPRSNQAPPRIGQRILVEGTTEPGFGLPYVNGATLKLIDAGKMPKPVTKDFETLFSGDDECNWVELRGTLRSIAEIAGRPGFSIVSGNKHMSILVRKPLEKNESYSRLIDATVRVQGVLVVQRDLLRRVQALHLLVTTFSEILIEKPGPADLFSDPITSIASVRSSGMQSGQRCHLRGVMAEQLPDGALRIEDASGNILVRTAQPISLRKGDRIDVMGFTAASSSSVPIEDASVRLLGDLSAFTGPRTTNGVASQIESDPVQVLTDGIAIRNLANEQASLGQPVRLRGIVTYYESETGDVILQDRTAGVRIEQGERMNEYKPGQDLEVDGHTTWGRFAPRVRAESVKILGAGPLPKPKILSPESIASGQEKGLWVEAQGVVRSAVREGKNLVLELAVGGQRLKAQVSGVEDPAFEQNLVDASVRLRGVCTTAANAKWQAIGTRLLTPSLEHVEVTERPPTDSFSIPTRGVNSLYRFPTPESGGHRIKIEGVITYFRAGEFMVLQEKHDGLGVKLVGHDAARVGDRVEVLGFPATSELGTILEDAIFRKIRDGVPPLPVDLTVEQALSGEFNGVLVSLEGRVIDHTVHPRGRVLVLQSGNVIFAARLQESLSNGTLENFREGCIVKVTGICQAELNSRRSPDAFGILLRSADDLKLKAGAPWWTPQRTRAVVRGMAGLILVSGAWVVLLRSRIRRQTEVIRERMEKEASLEKMYRELVQDAHDLVYTHDTNGQFTSINSAGERILGYKNDEALHLNIHQLVRPEQQESFRRELNSVLEGNRSSTFAVDVTTKLGRRVTLEVAMRPIQQNGQAVGVQGIARDITERKQSEAQRLAMERKLQESQKLESLGIMAGGVAHDFNNLLTAILGNASLARMDLPATSPAQTSLTEIEKTSLQAAELCKQMLAYSGRGQFVIEPVNLASLVEEMRHLLQISVHKKVSIHFDLGSRESIVEADPGQIRQVAINLIINASEAIGDEVGSIRVSTGSVNIDEADMSEEYVSGDLTPGSYVYLEVADTGCGMDAETKARIFDPFFTTKFTGRGLGLAAVLGIVRGHKGALKVVTEKGKGTAFTLLLPCAITNAEHSLPPSGAPQGWRGAGTVLVVDDELGVRKVTSRLVQSLGFKALQAEDGLAAVEIFKEHAQEIILVVLDLTMPRLNGQETLRRIKEIRPDAKVILMSGFTEHEIAKRFSKNELNGVLQKPFKPEDLRRKLREALEGDASFPGREVSPRQREAQDPVSV